MVEILNYEKPVQEGANTLRRRNLQILFNNTTLLPFKWRNKYMCFYCGQDIEKYDELKRHTIDHGKCEENDRAMRLIRAPEIEVKFDVSDITCKICNESLPSFDDIVSHLIEAHKLPYCKDADLSIKLYRLADLKCLECDEKFDFLRNLIRHTNNDHPENCFLCDQCEQKFNKKRDLKSHIRSHHKNEYKCLKCPLSFRSFTELNAHKSNSHVSICNFCFKTFASAPKRLKHMNKEHTFDGDLKCGLCLEILPNKQAFLRHATKCNLTGEETKYLDIEEEQAKKSTVTQLRSNIACILNMSTAIPFKHFMNKFRCFYCPKDFSECEDMKQHTVLEHPVCDVKLKCMRFRNWKEESIKIDTSSLSCKMCFETIPDLDTLINHLVSEHKARYDSTMVDIFQPFKLVKNHYVCPYCDKVHDYFGTLLKHVSKDHTFNRIICLYCGKAFRTDPNLRSHVIRYHKEARHKCPHCTSEFQTKNDLQLHLGKKHGERNIKCTQCSERFTTQYLMQRHLIAVHSTGHKCSFCGKLFTRHSFMMNHVKRLHLHEKNVECTVCFQKFFDMRRLKTHMVKHIGERNFHCDVCGKKFLWKKNLRGHMSSHIKHDEYPPNKDEYSASECRRTQRNLQTLFNNTTILPFKFRGKYICFFCDEKLTDYKSLRQHSFTHKPCANDSMKLMLKDNTDVMIDISEIKCSLCDEQFKSIDEIVNHLIAKHDLEYDQNIDGALQEFKLADLKCLHCEKQLTYFGDLLTHLNTEHPRNSFACNLCGLTMNSESNMITHMKKCHRKNDYKCFDCDKKFQTAFKLHSHQSKICEQSNTKLQGKGKNENVKDLSISELQCEFCSVTFHFKEGLRLHLNKCKYKPDSSKSATDSKQKQYLVKIRENIVCLLNMSTVVPFKFFTRFSCFYCPKAFVDFDELKSHSAIEHPVCDTKLKSIKRCRGERTSIKIDISCLACKLCHQPMNDLDTLVEHLTSVHKANYHKPIMECFEPFKVYKDNIPCPTCGEVFRYFNNLQRHINSAHNSNNNICTYCGKSFKKAANLSVHISYTHKGAVECEICSEKFRNQWCLLRHKAKFHDTKDFKCSKCSEMFQSQYHKQKHMIEAHGIGFKCSYCGKMFTRNSFMKDHIRRTHLKEKNFPCSICGERFFDKYMLKLHMAKHNGERKFICSYCGKGFLRRSNLHSHLTMHKKYGHIQPV